jgi:lysophospholipase L1-like esterase
MGARKYRTLVAAALAVVCLPGMAVAPGRATSVEVAEAVSVVQLGDSYSAGNGAGGYYGPQGCYRSQHSWGAQFADWLADRSTGGRSHVTFVSRACSDGVVADLRRPRSMGETIVHVPDAIGSEADARLEVMSGACKPKWDDEYYDVAVEHVGDTFVVTCERRLRPQVESVDLSTDLVLLTLGGNDLGFGDIVRSCFVPLMRSPEGCRDRAVTARGAMNRFGASLYDVLDDLRSRMRPDARVVLLSYPYLATETEYLLRGMPWSVPLDTADLVRRLGDEGDHVQRTAVDRANAAAGTEFVHFLDSVKDAFAGHEPNPGLRANPDAWIWALESLILPENYHPNQVGHSQEAALLRDVAAVPSRAIGSGAASMDLVFVVDSTASMSSYVAQVRRLVLDMAALLEGSSTSYRFALVSYTDDPRWTGVAGAYASRVDVPFTTDAEELRQGLESLRSISGGFDYPESVLSGLDEAISMPWRAGVKKVVIPIGDGPGRDPEQPSGLTREAVIQRSLAVDPVEVFPVSVAGSSFATWLAPVAEATGGQTSVAGADLAATLTEALGYAFDKPFPWLRGPWVLKVGDTLRLDARGSYSTTGEIVRYAWDVDGDGVVDRITTEPVIDHTYDAEVDGFATVRVTDELGRESLGSTLLTVSRDGDDVPDDVDNCPDDLNPGQEDADGDGIGDVCDPEPWPEAPEDPPFAFGPDEVHLYAAGAVSGSAFEDLDGDGERGADELGAAGRRIQLDGVDAWDQAVTAVTVSAGDGSWTFDGLLPGRYGLTESAGWVFTRGAPTETSVGSAAGEVVAGAVSGLVLLDFGHAVDGFEVGGRTGDSSSAPGQEQEASPATDLARPTRAGLLARTGVAGALVVVVALGFLAVGCLLRRVSHS